jgi:ABC-type glycerol-3-phosphate transport system permease component
MPLCKPALFTVGLFAFSGSYDNFFSALLYINSIKKFTIQLGLRAFAASDSYTEWGPIFAMIILTMIPLILAFILTQKNLIKGINTTGLKG